MSRMLGEVMLKDDLVMIKQKGDLPPVITAPMIPGYGVDQHHPFRPEWMVLINPVAGDHRGRDDWGKISLLLDHHKIIFQHYFTEHPRHAVQLGQDFLRQGYRNFIIAGGDGFLHEVVNAIFTQTAVDPKLVTLAMIPVGTGNDWVRTFNIPADYEAAIGIIRKRKALKHDIGRVF